MQRRNQDVIEEDLNDDEQEYQDETNKNNKNHPFPSQTHSAQAKGGRRNSEVEHMRVSQIHGDDEKGATQIEEEEFDDDVVDDL